MKHSRNLIGLLALAGAMAAAGYAKKAPLQLAGATCQNPPVSHCPEKDCPGPLVIEQGPVVEPKTGRKFFLDYPCDLKKGEKVTFILSLHGGGSYGNWQRHYFPIMDYAQKYRLVIATPNAPPRVWAATDDEYLQNIVNLIYEQIGKKNIKAFWLVGHSQGGMTSNRLVRTDFFKERVDGWLSLSGGRLGPTPPIAPGFFTAGGPGRARPGASGAAAPSGAAPSTPGASAAAPGGANPATPPAGSVATPAPGRLPGMAALREPPPGEFSFIYETGEHEVGDQPIPDASPWATKLGCGARVNREDVVDTKPGYVYDGTRQDPGSDAWGRLPRPGKAAVMVYPNCKNGRVVADVVRIGKGHTEGLEPQITEELVKLMLSAKK